jgi:hypothetical protein
VSERSQALEISKTWTGGRNALEDHPDTLHAMANLAATYSQLKEFTKAEELQVVVLEKQKQLLGDNHPDTLHAMENLASTYRSLDKLTKAEELEKFVKTISSGIS